MAFLLTFVALVASSLGPGNPPWMSPHLATCAEVGSTTARFEFGTQQYSETLHLDTSGWSLPANTRIAGNGTMLFVRGGVGADASLVVDSFSVDGMRISAFENVPIRTYSENKTATTPQILPSSIDIRVRRAGGIPSLIYISCVKFSVAVEWTNTSSSSTSGSSTTTTASGSSSSSQSLPSTTTVSTGSVSSTNTGSSLSVSTSSATRESSSTTTGGTSGVHNNTTPSPLDVQEEEDSSDDGEAEVGLGLWLLPLVGSVVILASISGVSVYMATYAKEGVPLPLNHDLRMPQVTPVQENLVQLTKDPRAHALVYPARETTNVRDVVKLEHPHLAPCLGIDTQSMLAYAVRPSFRWCLQDVAALSPSASLKISYHIALGLQAIHNAALVHGRLTLDNVIIDRGIAILVDYAGALPDHPWRLGDRPSRAGDLWDLSWVIWQLFHGGAGPCAPQERDAFLQTGGGLAGRVGPSLLPQQKMQTAAPMEMTFNEILQSCRTLGDQAEDATIDDICERLQTVLVSAGITDVHTLDDASGVPWNTA